MLLRTDGRRQWRRERRAIGTVRYAGAEAGQP